MVPQKLVKVEKPKADVRSWLELKPYWEQYLWQLHAEKENLEELDIEKCYQYLLEDSGVIQITPERPAIKLPLFDLEGAEATTIKATLDKIENLKDVNAIDSGCVIGFCKNLTIIYGDNGSGKSGIGRLFSNACSSRKPRKLLSNARQSPYPVDPKASADFYVTDATGAKVINYTLGETHDVLKSFSVFDHECALVHLNSENKVEFVPAKIQIFDEVFKDLLKIENKLNQETESKRKSNPTEGFFPVQTKITEFLANLSHLDTDAEIDTALRSAISIKLQSAFYIHFPVFLIIPYVSVFRALCARCFHRMVTMFCGEEIDYLFSDLAIWW